MLSIEERKGVGRGCGVFRRVLLMLFQMKLENGVGRCRVLVEVLFEINELEM
jgi:hypothetical protein